MTFTNTELDTLKERLPKGSINKLASRFKTSKQYISQTLDGEHPKRIDIIEAAVIIAEQHQRKYKTVKKKLNNLKKSK